MKIKQQPGAPRKPWSKDECLKLVKLYESFYFKQVLGQEYQKAGPVRELAADIGRSKGSIEAKMMNLSAVRSELGYGFVDGYKPLSGYQKLLKDVFVELNGVDND